MIPHDDDPRDAKRNEDLADPPESCCQCGAKMVGDDAEYWMCTPCHDLASI